MQVLTAAGKWFTCQARPEAAGDKSATLNVYRSRIEIAQTGEEVRVAGPEELGQALEKRMRETPGPWTMSFGYITMIPKRMYFTVHFDQQGRVVRVGEAGWGILN